MSGVCLVTGATGFIGGHLAHRLIERGYQVRALARPTSDTRSLERLNAEIVPGDLGDPTSITRAASGAAYVLHCGALVSDWATVPEMRQINVAGTRHVMQAARRAGVTRVVHFSTTDVYGHPGYPVDEGHAPTRFSNWYSRTKLEAESEVRRAASTGELQAVILRPATIYGPGSVNVVGEIGKAVRARNMLLIDRGRPVAGLCYIDNLIDAAILALTQEAASGHTFNVTDGLEITWREFVGDLARGLGSPAPRFSLPYPAAHGLGLAMERSYRLLHAATGVTTPPLLSRQAVDVMGRNQSFSNARLKGSLGWKPRVSYETGLERTLSWLADHLRPAPPDEA